MWPKWKSNGSKNKSLDSGLLVPAAVGVREANSKPPGTVLASERALREELDRLLTDGITDEELENARSFLIGRDPFRRETARGWADVIAEAEFYGLQNERPEWVREVLTALSRQDVEAAARRWIRPEELRLTVGLPKSE